MILDSEEFLMSQDVQIVFLGSGREDLRDRLMGMQERNHHAVRAWIGFSNQTAHRITACERHPADAEQARAVRPQPAVRHALRDRARRARGGRLARHREANANWFNDGTGSFARECDSYRHKRRTAALGHCALQLPRAQGGVHGQSTAEECTGSPGWATPRTSTEQKLLEPCYAQNEKARSGRGKDDTFDEGGTGRFA